MPDRETTVKSAPEKANDVPDAPFGMKWSEIFIILGGGAAFAAHAIKGMNYLRRANKIKKQIEEYQNSNTK